MTIIITAFESSPIAAGTGAGYARFACALEEVGLPYDVRLVSSRR